MIKKTITLVARMAGLTMLASCSTVSKSSQNEAVGEIASASEKRCSPDTLIPGSNPPAYESECGSSDNPGYCYVVPGANSGTCRFLQFAQKPKSAPGQSCSPDTRENGIWSTECGEMGTGVTCAVERGAKTGKCLQWEEEESTDWLGWREAFDHCENLSKDGGGWRLPTADELDSLNDLGLFSVDRHSEAVFGEEKRVTSWSSTCFPSGKVATSRNSCKKSAFWGGKESHEKLNKIKSVTCVRELNPLAE